MMATEMDTDVLIIVDTRRALFSHVAGGQDAIVGGQPKRHRNSPARRLWKTAAGFYLEFCTYVGKIERGMRPVPYLFYPFFPTFPIQSKARIRFPISDQ